MCGFSFNSEDFWLGLKKINSIAQQGVYILRIDLEDWKQVKHWAEHRFSLEGPSKDYAIHVSHYFGDLHDAMTSSDGMRFSTKDRNDNNHQSPNCVRNYTGSEFLTMRAYMTCMPTIIINNPNRPMCVC